MTNNKNNRFNNIVKDLTSGEEKKVLTAIKQLRKHGNSKAIQPLVEVLNNSESEEVSNAIINLLYDLKDQTATNELILAVEDDKYESLKPTLLSVFWQSKLDASDYLDTLIKEAIKGDYLVGVEVMTIIDSFDNTFNEEEVNDLKYDIEDAITSEESEDKAKLLLSIRQSIEQLNIEF